MYPAYAGISPRPGCMTTAIGGLLRMSGDMSAPSRACSQKPSFSPHARGYFYRIPKWQIGIWCTPFARGYVEHEPTVLRSACIFPAWAGIVLRCSQSSLSTPCLPRVSGDSSDILEGRALVLSETPHKRGCFSHEPDHWQHSDAAPISGIR